MESTMCFLMMDFGGDTSVVNKEEWRTRLPQDLVVRRGRRRREDLLCVW
jgi:hypothetical protein